ncbi:MAG: hypothetical protein IT578_04625 [Verrucomicrobiae bacterium]|nr:hypothetical protein [Verrucomicrobiae bacterium]
MASLVLLGASLPVCAQEPTFHAPFDNSFTASTASGDVEPVAKQGVYTFEKGAFDNALKVGAPDSYLLYTAGSGLCGDEGTVSLWVQPEWTADDGKFHMLWSFLGDGVFNLYKFGGGENKLNFLVVGHDQPRDHHVIVSTSIANWKAGEPHHLAATWTAGLLQLFVDGEKVGELSDPKLLLPNVRPGDALFIGDYYHPNWGTQAGMSGEADTLIRDFRLYDKALTAAQIAKLAGVKKKAVSDAKQAVAARPSVSPPFVVVPRAKTSPKVDGNFSLDEWRDAAAFTGFVNLMTGLLSELQTTVLLTYDADKFYVAMFSLLPSRADLKVSADARDSQTWNDDSYEVLLDPANARQTGRSFHLIGNAGNALYDDRDNDASWNGAWEYRSQLQENWRGVGLRCWVVEMAIPFASLGRKTPADGERWTANFARTWFLGEQTFTSWIAPPTPKYNTPEAFGALEFRKHAPVCRWITLRDVATGQPTVEGYWKSPKPGTFALTPGREFALPAAEQTPERWLGELDLTGQPTGLLRVAALLRSADSEDSALHRSAATLYRAEIPYALDLTPLRVFLSPVPSREQLLVDVDPVRHRKSWKDGWRLDLGLFVVPPLGGAARIPPKGGTTNAPVARQSITTYQPPFAHAVFDTRRLAPGPYQLVAALRDQTGKVVATQTVPYEKRPRPAWVGNQIGVTDKVLKPWTPVKVSKRGFNVWGRTYTYDRAHFPAHITSQGVNLLARPIRIATIKPNVEKSASREAKNSAPARLRVLRSAPAAADFETRTDELSVQNRLEFDGMLWCEATLPAGKVESLALEIPLRPEAATLYHVSRGAWAGGAHTPGATPSSWNSSWKQCVWLGNENVGLCWFAESDQFWSLADPQRALEIERRAEAPVLRVNFVTKPKTYASAPTFRFGLQATPMRPMPAGWRGWQFPSGAGYNPEPDNPQRATHAISWWMNWSPRICSPFDYLPGMKDLVARNHKFGIRVIPYQALQCVNENAPDVADYKAEWLVRPAVEAGGEQGQRCLWVNVKGSFGDYFLYGMREMVRAAGWDGMYFDFCEGAKPDLNELHGSGYVDDEGKRRPTYDILAQREFLKRLWAMFQQEFGNDEPIIMVHLSANKVPPIHSFCNVYFDGEQHNYVPKVDDDYTKILSLDTYRAEFLGQQFGGVPVLLPELNHLQVICEQSKDPAVKAQACARWRSATDTMLIYPLLHGTLFTPNWLDQDDLRPLLQARSAFGMADARFIGYWESNPAIQLSPASDTLKASVYIKPNKLWLVVGNLGDISISAAITLDMRQLSPNFDLAATKTKNIFGKGALDASGNTIRLEVPRKSLRVIELNAKQ